MDSFIYSLVLVPALTELLPRSGIAATPGNVGYYGSVLFALFLIGWGVSMMWGPIADRFGRVRTLTLTILCYSLFTLLCGVVTDIWQLAVLRFLAGIGIGGEWSMGGTFIAEEWPEDRRKAGGGGASALGTAHGQKTAIALGTPRHSATDGAAICTPEPTITSNPSLTRATDSNSVVVSSAR